MPDALLFLLAVVVNIASLGWLALAMEVHWEQALGPVPASSGTAKLLRVSGVMGLVVSLLLCLSVDHASMASLVWFMTLAGSALTIAFTLTWRPHWLGLLVARLQPAA